MATMITTIASIPQIYKSLKTKQVEALSYSMIACMIIGMGLWLIYGIILHLTPLIIVNIDAVSINVVLLFVKIKLSKKQPA